ncbi:hypothetical protein L6164_010003 [Bauhinia variegata]|uniref:Uncharacterized protein n=1 Tax=Bauhinia variegata TaxID=167791 RepID=A0ACB9PPF0_BAUVA|nr:hypothetical protein L6164_010003 [Bauhinia variegata]
MKRVLHNIHCTNIFLKRQEPYRNYLHNVLSLLQLQRSRADKVDGDKLKEVKTTPQVSFESKIGKEVDNNSQISKYSSDDEGPADRKWSWAAGWLILASTFSMLYYVGHSLGGAIAALLTIMIHRKSFKELGFSPDIVSSADYGTPPCVSRELAESCSGYEATVLMQDDIIPTLSVASLTMLRNEILYTDWMSVIEKEDWKSVKDLVTNAKQVVSSVQGVARKLSEYANLRRNSGSTSGSIRKELPVTRKAPRIILSSNLISDHKCGSPYYALRDVLKSLPWGGEEGIFR